MNNELERAQVYQILALNDEMLRSGCITRDEHDFVRHLQTDSREAESRRHQQGCQQDCQESV